MEQATFFDIIIENIRESIGFIISHIIKRVGPPDIGLISFFKRRSSVGRPKIVDSIVAVTESYSGASRSTQLHVRSRSNHPSVASYIIGLSVYVRKIP